MNVAIPSQLSARLEIIESLSGPSASRFGIWRVRDSLDSTEKVLKCAAPHSMAEPDLLAHLRQLRQEVPGIVIADETGQDEQVAWSLSRWMGDQTTDLARALANQEWNDLGREVVLTLHQALSVLHQVRGRNWVLHGDIKPANILISRLHDAPPQVFLADFDGARLASQLPSAEQLRRYTPRQSAPEVIARLPLTPAADWWSVGMTVFEALAGRHPLESLTEAAQRSLLAGDWRPDIAKIEDSDWRALLGGLFQRNASSRWGASEVGLWLQGDIATRNSGLHLAGEAASDLPFQVAGRDVYTARDLARMALTHWQVIT